MLLFLPMLVCIYNDDILYIIYYNNILYCYVAKNKKKYVPIWAKPNFIIE